MNFKKTAVCLLAVVAAAFAMTAESASGGKKAEKAKEAIKGSIAVVKMSDSALVDLAKISVADAVAAAVAKVPGKAWKAELEAEDGSLLYTVQVVTKEGEWKEIAVDAGNGAILMVEKGDQEEFEGTQEKKKEGCKKGEKDGKDNDKDGDDEED